MELEDITQGYPDIIFITQFTRDILWSIGCVYEDSNGRAIIDCSSLSEMDERYLVQIAEGMEYRLELEQLITSRPIRCEMGRLFAYYILGMENQSANSIINSDYLKKMYACFSLQKPLKITYSIFGGVKITY